QHTYLDVPTTGTPSVEPLPRGTARVVRPLARLLDETCRSPLGVHLHGVRRNHGEASPVQLRGNARPARRRPAPVRTADSYDAPPVPGVVHDRPPLLTTRTPTGSSRRQRRAARTSGTNVPRSRGPRHVPSRRRGTRSGAPALRPSRVRTPHRARSPRRSG